ncbi:6-hydroxymethylpterin diphosphokinase MptE-like protein [Cohnella caldifontis]|uniref:motility associated factor glycosyltransferase family protein n=1 Tax=Cohnella caldifontis TaxID=3027471 RepID=UPI0023EAF90A|nr:6-hydroxymethylpterin diphosphokinase MptE-like protein [Cohnella sp. YIM B05605]
MKISVADNLLFLRDQYPEIYRLIRNREMNKQKYVSQQSRSGQQNLGIVDEDGNVRSLYSKYDPELECRRWAESQSGTLEGAGDVLLLGVGLGYHALALISAYPDKRIFLYEPDLEMLLAAVHTVDIRPLLRSKQVSMFAVGSEESVKTELLLEIYKFATGRLAIAATPHVTRNDLEELKQWESLVPEMARTYASDVGTIAHHQQVWIENVFRNLPKNLKTPTFYPLKGAFQGVPVVIAGSGPSLELEAERLRALQDHVLIIAAGTAAAGLQHLGIQPHLVVTMDPGEPNRIAFEHLDLKDCPLLYITTVKHEVVQDENDPYLMHGYFTMDVLSHYLMELRQENGVLLSTATVTGTAVQLAAHMGCTEITFIGQDFSYPQGKSYSSGVGHISMDEQKKNVSAADLETPNVSGGMNRTNLSMLNLKEDVERLIKAFPWISFYNASPVGAVIEQTELRSLDQVLESNQDRRFTRDDVKRAMQQRLSLYPPEAKTKLIQRTRNMQNALEEMEESIDRLKRAADQSTGSPKEWLERFERNWKEIVDSELFERVLSYFLLGEKNHAERHWPQMFATTDFSKKKELLLYCVQPLVQGMDKLLPVLQVHSKSMLAKIEGKEGSHT